MKITDYGPRVAPFDSHLTGEELIGVEVGVDVGAHAEALLTYCPVRTLHLVDPWPNDYARGYCAGRLARWRARVRWMQMGSLEAATAFLTRGLFFDFVYIDQQHDADSVRRDLYAWWPLIKAGGVLGHRNYSRGRAGPLDVEIDKFVSANGIRTDFELYLNDIILHK